MSGDDPEELESVWHSTGEVLPMRVLAAGGAFLEELEGYDNKSEIIVSALKKRRSKVRFKEISSKLIKGIASEDEIREYLRIKQELKDIIF
jgi:DNA primase